MAEWIDIGDLGIYSFEDCRFDSSSNTLSDLINFNCRYRDSTFVVDLESYDYLTISEKEKYDLESQIDKEFPFTLVANVINTRDE